MKIVIMLVVLLMRSAAVAWFLAGVEWDRPDEVHRLITGHLISREGPAPFFDLEVGKREKEAAATLTSLANLRLKLKRDMQAMEDYIDWSEATQADGFSGDFDEYLQTAGSLAKPPPPRRDPISRYMNLMENEYKMEE